MTDKYPMSNENDLRTLLELFRDDMALYARQCLKIKTKTGHIQPFVMNLSQLYLHNRLEEQKHKTGMVRALLLKGRQFGGSTYIEARLYHQLLHSLGKTAFIIAQDLETSRHIFNIVNTFHKNVPELFQVPAQVDNVRELVFKAIDSHYKVLTAAASGAGRGQTAQLLHCSEVAFWPNADQNWQSTLQTVPDLPGTEIILESTSAGPSGSFYEKCMQAHRGEDPDYQLIFIPWHWTGEYVKRCPKSYELDLEEIELQSEHGLSRDQLFWRRTKIGQIGRLAFMREYPISIEEAFRVDAIGALWDRETIARNRVRADQVPEMRSLIVGIDPASSNNKRSDETGIILFGLGQDNHGYVLEDRTGKYSPEGWASQVIALAQKGYNGQPANLITAETNQGGQMVESVLKACGSRFPYKGTHVMNSKRARAEPVASLYSMGMIHHVGVLGPLEDEMTNWNAQTKRDNAGNIVPANDKSPNRIDALTRCVHQLMDIGEPGIIGYYQILLDEAQSLRDGTQQEVISELPRKNIFNTF